MAAHSTRPARVARTIDRESSEWLARLSAPGHVRDAAIAELHALLLRAARFEVAPARRAPRTCAAAITTTSPSRAPTTRSSPILGKLGDFRGESRFTTWAYKFALYEAAAKVRRRAWQGREIPLESEAWRASPTTPRPRTATPRRTTCSGARRRDRART